MTLSAPIYHLKRLAKRLSRDSGIPLHAALDRIAQREGYASWSLLAVRANAHMSAAAIFARLSPGDLVLLGARPRQGKTTLGLALLAEAVKAGHRGLFFTLDYNEKQAWERFQSFGDPVAAGSKSIDINTSDDICADYIVAHMASSPPGTLAVIDYLQLLDQKRSNPALAHQVTALREFAGKAGAIIVFLSQIDRAFDMSAKPFPELTDVRLPNPVDLAAFSKVCFLNNGQQRIEAVR